MTIRAGNTLRQAPEKYMLSSHDDLVFASIKCVATEDNKIWTGLNNSH